MRSSATSSDRGRRTSTPTSGSSRPDLPSEEMSWLLAALSSQAIVELGSDLDAANDLARANPAGGHIWHLSLSLPAGDRPLTDDQWAEVARKATEAIGFEREGLEPAAWVAVAHGASAQGNQHIHIAASLVRLDGSRVETWQSKRTISRVCAEVEHTYGLTVVEGRAGRGMPGLTRAELERTAREQLAEPPRITLARIVREASVASRDEAEFVRRLRGSGVLVRPRFETGGNEAVIGYSVAVRPRVGDTPIWFGGGKLAKDLTLPSLRQFWELSPSDRRAAVAEWTMTRSVSGREAVRGVPGDLQRAVGMVSDAAELLASAGVGPCGVAGSRPGDRRGVCGLVETYRRRHPGPSGSHSRRIGPFGSEPAR